MPDCARMEVESGAGGKGRCHELVVHSREGSRSGIEEGGAAGGAYKRVSRIWRKRRLVVIEDDGKDFVLFKLSSVRVCRFVGL